MPPRPFVVVVVIGWLAALGWLVADRWLPWLRPSDEPAFVVDLADEVAPEHASWSLNVRGKKLGAESRIAPRKDGSFEHTSRLRELDLPHGPIVVQVTVHSATQILSNEGRLKSLVSRTSMHVTGLGIDSRLDALIHGEVVESKLIGECELILGETKVVEPIEPIDLAFGNAFSPLQPRQKFPPLRPGQSWRLVNIDPLALALNAALKHVVGQKLGLRVAGDEEPAELLARVEADTEEIAHKQRTHTCRVITYQAQRVVAKSWVSVEDGKVLRHEAIRNGQPIMLQRE